MRVRITLNDTDYLEYRDASGGTIELYDIAVMSERQRGIGKQLIQMMLDREKPRFVYGFTRISNNIARIFYQKQGYAEILVPSMYAEEDAIMVCKSITSENSEESGTKNA